MKLLIAGLAGLLLTGGCGRSADEPAATGSAGPIAPGPDLYNRLQTALILAEPGDTLELAEGVFDLNATLSLDKERIRLKGQGADKTRLRFQEQQAGTGGEGLLVTAGGFTLEDLAIEDARTDAVKITNATGVTLRRVRVEWTGGPKATNGSYGLYPVLCQDVLIEDCEVKGASDAGIYVGQSQNIIVRRNRVEQNVAGIEIENSIGADVYDNHVTNNAGGILVFTLPDLVQKTGHDCRIFENRVFANNHANFAPAGNIVAEVPSGTGIMLLATDRVEVFSNKLEDNQSVNLSVVSYLATGRPFTDAGFDPYCESIYIHDNTFVGGGTAPALDLAALAALMGGQVPDVICDAAQNPARLVDGRLPAELGIWLDGNGDADFARVDLVSLLDTSLSNLAGLLSGSKISRDLASHTGQLPALTAIRIAGVDESPGGATRR